jgi:hypothetical protein
MAEASKDQNISEVEELVNILKNKSKILYDSALKKINSIISEDKEILKNEKEEHSSEDVLLINEGINTLKDLFDSYGDKK